MANLFGVRFLLNGRKLSHPQFYALSRRLASDTSAFHRKHSSGTLLCTGFCYQYNFSNSFTPVRSINLSAVGFSENDVEVSASSENKKPIDPSKVRDKVIPPEVSIRYMKSKAYCTTYGDEPVWVKYRRNFKGRHPPSKTRRFCIKEGMLRTGNPCPICRDEYLVVHYSNVELLNQFVSPHTGEVYPTSKTNVCRQKQFDIEVAVEQAKNLGLLTFEVPFRTYNYEEYYPQLQKQDKA